MSAPSATISLEKVDRLAGRKIGTFDVPCPACGPERQSAANQKRKVMRIWRISSSFATYRCARCELHGYVREDGAPSPDAVEVAKARWEAQLFGAAAAEGKQQKARWLWARRRPPAGTIAETYLRTARSYAGPLPATIGFLPSRTGFPPAMISVFGFSDDWEAAPRGEAIQGAHLTRLAADGSGKAGTDTDKIMIGTPRGAPIMLAPINDGLGLAITEGIEDGLSIFEATGLGVWAAGSAPFLPALADVVPDYVEAVSIISDPDEVGRRFACDLATRLRKRRIGHRVLVWGNHKLVRVPHD